MKVVELGRWLAAYRNLNDDLERTIWQAVMMHFYIRPAASMLLTFVSGWALGLLLDRLIERLL